MCIPHGAVASQSSGFVKKDKPKKHIQRVSQSEFEKGDPDFIDERVTQDEAKKNESFLASLFE